MEEKILIVDDEKTIVDALAYALKKEGYIIERAYNGKEAIDKFRKFRPKVMILDIMLPNMSGYDVCRELSEENVGIIMLTAKDDIVNKVLGLELGADDYLTKPFDIREVIARVKSLIRRFNRPCTEENLKEIIEFDGLKLNSKYRKVIINNEDLNFTRKEFDILYTLLSDPGRVYSRQELLDYVWGIDYIGGTRTVDTHIQRLRRKLGQEYEDIIITVHGIGYKGEVHDKDRD